MLIAGLLFLNFLKASKCLLFILIDAIFNIAEFDLRRINAEQTLHCSNKIPVLPFYPCSFSSSSRSKFSSFAKVF